MNYEALLKKFIEYVGDVEGSDFIEPHDQRAFSKVEFTDDEWRTLQRLSREVTT